MKKLLWCFAFLSVLGFAFTALAQVQNGAFTGTVTDPSGAAVPNAKVTITNLGTNLPSPRPPTIPVSITRENCLREPTGCPPRRPGLRRSRTTTLP